MWSGKKTVQEAGHAACNIKMWESRLMVDNYIIIKMVCKNWEKEEESDTVGGMKN